MKIERFVVNPFQENTYIVSDETKQGVIIDCGASYTEERKAIMDGIKENDITIKHLIATHAHIDHCFGNNTIYDELGVKPEVFKDDEYLMAKLEKQALDFCNYHLGYDMPPVGKYLDETDVIEFGTHRFSVIPTPGHTPGSVFFYCEEENIAFSGDTLFKMSIGRTDFEKGSYKDIMNSLQKLKECLPPDTIVLPGHGPKTTIGQEISSNPYMR